MIIAWFSCGVTSAVACKIALSLYEDVHIYYIDTGEWIFGYYLEFSLFDGEGRCSYIQVDGCQPIKVDPDTVSQFTELLKGCEEQIGCVSLRKRSPANLKDGGDRLYSKIIRLLSPWDILPLSFRRVRCCLPCVLRVFHQS